MALMMAQKQNDASRYGDADGAEEEIRQIYHSEPMREERIYGDLRFLFDHPDEYGTSSRLLDKSGPLSLCRQQWRRRSLVPVIG